MITEVVQINRDEKHIALTASASGRQERYGRGTTTHTIHVWWARRPHSAIAALIRNLPNTARNRDARLKTLDIFSGGGTIPFEAAKAGHNVHSLDCNPLSIFHQKALLVWSQAAFQQLGRSAALDLVRSTGKAVLNMLADRTAPLFPLRVQKGPFGYLWSYTLSCSSCGFHFRLSKRPWLSKKKGKSTGIFPTPLQGSREHVEIAESCVPPQLNWDKRNIAVCPKCKAEHKKPSIRDTTDALLALAYTKEKRKGKCFDTDVTEAVPSLKVIRKYEQQALAELKATLPNTLLPKWSGIVNPSLYGIETYADFLNPRQRAVLLILTSILHSVTERLEDQHGREVALFVSGALSGLIDQLVDWNCRLSMWIPQNEQVGRAFCGPGVPMLWDYVESDPVLDGPSNLWDKLKRITSGLLSVPVFDQPPSTGCGIAQSLPFPSESFDYVITDPPYYDNIYYGLLADFFYVWKRLAFRKFDPDLFEADSTISRDELVASKFKSGTSAAAHQTYSSDLGKALSEVKRVLRRDGRLVIVYTHGALQGWLAILEAFRCSGLQVEEVIPLNVERKARPRAVNSNAINTCVAFVATKWHDPTLSIASEEELIKYFQTVVVSVLKILKRGGWAGADVGIAGFAYLVGKLVNARRPISTSDAADLLLCEQLIRTVAPEFGIQQRSSL